MQADPGWDTGRQPPRAAAFSSHHEPVSHTRPCHTERLRAGAKPHAQLSPRQAIATDTVKLHNHFSFVKTHLSPHKIETDSRVGVDIYQREGSRDILLRMTAEHQWQRLLEG